MRVHRLQPGPDGLVVNELPGADAAGEHHHLRCAHLVEGGVAGQAQHPVLGAHLAPALPDEHDLDRRNPLQHFVRAHRIQCGDPREQRDGDQRHVAPASAGSGSAACPRRDPTGRSQSGSQPGGASGARSNGPPAGSSTRPPHRTRSSSGR